MRRLTWIRLAYRSYWHIEAAGAQSGQRRTECGKLWSTNNVRDYYGEAGPARRCRICDALVPLRRS